MTIKEVMSMQRINSTVNKRSTWLRLFSMNTYDSKTQQLTCTKLYCANTSAGTKNKFTYQSGVITTAQYLDFAIRKLAVADSRNLVYFA